MNDSVPDIVLYLSILDQFDHNVHVPDQIFRELFSKDCDFKHKVVMDVRIYSVLEVSEELGHND